MEYDINRFEKEFLSPFAARSINSRGRSKPVTPCDYRTDFQRDRDRILHSKSFRRLKYKTQVFLSPDGDHYHTRLTHTLKVSQIARTISRALRLNEDLAEAISLGHDLGHTPFGHIGEEVLNRLNIHGFKHNEHSLRVCDYLEDDGVGLNLTWEVRDGILTHKLDGLPSTLEGKIVSYADRIAYINHDIEDAISAGILSPSDIPPMVVSALGNNKSERISTLISGIISHCEGKNFIALPDALEMALADLRKFMFDYVYRNPIAKSEEVKADKMMSTLYEFYMTTPTALPKFYLDTAKSDIHIAVTDFIAGMTDRYAVSEFSKIFIPKNWNV